MSKRNLVMVATVMFGTLGTIVPVAAENNPSDSTNIGYLVTQQYEWNIPTSIQFIDNSNTDTKQLTVSVTKNIIESKKSLHIALASDSTFKIADTESPSNTRDYTVKSGSTAYSKGDDVLLVPSGTNTGSKVLDFTLQSVSVQKAGVYKGTVSFASSVK